MTDTNQLDFINNRFPELLKSLTPGTPRKWGMMDAQQMVEHLTDYVRIATGKNPVDVVTPEEHLPAFRKFLLSEKQFRPETKNPLNTGSPNPLRMGNLEEAIEEYLAEMNEFHAVFQEEPGKMTAHPSFGFCSYEDWLRLQYKHLTHHARQFGLIAE